MSNGDLVEVNIHQIDELSENITTMENITEQKFLELAEDFKGIVLEKDIELKKVKKQLNDYKFMMYKILGITSFLEDIIIQLDIGHYQQTVEHNLSYINEQIKMLLAF